MTKSTDDWNKWIEKADKLVFNFQTAVDYNQRDDEFSTAMDMMEFLHETAAQMRFRDDT